MGIDLTIVITAVISAAVSIITILAKERENTKKLIEEHTKELEKARKEASQNISSMSTEEPIAVGPMYRKMYRDFSALLEEFRATQALQHRAAKKNLTMRVTSHEHDALIFKELFSLLGKPWECSRAYILQVHPRKKAMHASVYYKALADGVSDISTYYIDLDLAKYPLASQKLSSTPIITIVDVQSVRDENAKALLSATGVKYLCALKLVDLDGNWVGDLVCEYTDTPDSIDLDALQQYMIGVGTKIKNLIPDIQ